MIVSDACTINVLLALALALVSVINYADKWCYGLDHHLLMALESSFTIVLFKMQATVFGLKMTMKWYEWISLFRGQTLF